MWSTKSAARLRRCCNPAEFSCPALCRRHRALATSVSISSGARTSSACSTASRSGAACVDPSMMRTTAEASTTRLDVPRAATSAGAVQTDQLLRGWGELDSTSLAGHQLEFLEGLAAPLARIAPAGLLEIRQGLLTQAAVMLPGSELQQLMQRIGEITDLKRRHLTRMPNACNLHADSDASRLDAPPCGSATVRLIPHNRNAPSSLGTIPLRSSSTAPGSSICRHCCVLSCANWWCATAASTPR